MEIKEWIDERIEQARRDQAGAINGYDREIASNNLRVWLKIRIQWR